MNLSPENEHYYYYHSFLRVYFNLIGCIIRNYGFNCTFMYVRSQKFEYFGHWLSDVNTLQIKNFDTQLVFIRNTFKPKISTKPQNADF